MGNHCVYSKCYSCKTDYCERCSYTCKCGAESEDPAIKERERKALEEYYRNNPMPEGWF